MNEEEQARRASMSAAVQGTIAHFRSKPVDASMRLTVTLPADPTLLAGFASCLEGVSQVYPLLEQAPIREDVVFEAAARLTPAGLMRFDPEDGSDYAELIADAYFAARSNVAACSIGAGGQA